MQSISVEVVESATIDGANSSQLFFQIILPQVKPVLYVSILFCITGSLKAFEHPFIMTFGGPGVYSSFLAVEMYKSAYFLSRTRLWICYIRYHHYLRFFAFQNFEYGYE